MAEMSPRAQALEAMLGGGAPAPESEAPMPPMGESGGDEELAQNAAEALEALIEAAPPEKKAKLEAVYQQFGECYPELYEDDEAEIPEEEIAAEGEAPPAEGPLPA